MDSITAGYFPPNKVSYKEKDDEWQKACIDGTINICYSYGRTRRSSSGTKRRNYNLFNNKINKADFDYVLNPFNLSKEKLKEFNFPASLQAYDSWSKYIHLLLGEESKRIFNPLILAINQESTSEKQNIKQKEILALLEQILTTGIQQDPNNPGPPPEELEKYSNYTPKMMRESVAEKLLNHYYRHEHLDQMFNQCFKDVLIAGEEIIRIDRIGDGPKVTRVNPLEIWYQLNSNSETLDDAEKIYERNQMTVSEIIDEFYEYLTPAQVDELEQWGESATGLYDNNQLFVIPEVDSIYSFEDNWYQRGIPVHRARWKSKKKIGTLHYLDENNQEQEQLVDETFKINKQDKTQYIEWFWVNEYWEGVRIGQDMYLKGLTRPRKQQFRSIDNLSECKSGYIGTVYSSTNSQGTSMLDRMVPWIYLYLIVWYRTELAMAKNIGKIALIDVSLIPDGWEPEKWMYYGQAMGFGFVNSYNEGNKAQGINGMNLSTQNKALDLETGNYIQGHIDILNYIELKFEDVTGVSRQRLGTIQTSELVGNTERAVQQSSHITEPYFAPHEFFKLRVCEAVIEVAKECLENQTKNFQYITDDLAPVLFSVQGDDFINADYGVFLSNATKDQQSLDMLKQLMQAALQNDKIQLSSVIDILNTNSLSDVKARLLKSEEKMQQFQQESEKANQALQQQIHKETMDLEQQKLDLEKYKIDQDNETRISVEQMKSLAIDEGASPQSIIDTGANALKQQELNSKHYIEQEKLKHDKNTKDKELAIKEKELKSKQEIEKSKLAQVTQQNKSQEIIQKRQADLKEKELKNKIILEKMRGETALKVQRAKPRPSKVPKKK